MCKPKENIQATSGGQRTESLAMQRQNARSWSVSPSTAFSSSSDELNEEKVESSTDLPSASASKSTKRRRVIIVYASVFGFLTVIFQLYQY
jgi:hypothetical protein